MKRAKSSSALWMLSLMGSLSLANSSSVAAPGPTLALIPEATALVPEDHYLDLGLLPLRAPSSAGYTAVGSPLANEAQGSTQQSPELDPEQRYIDLGRTQDRRSSPAVRQPGD